MELLETYTQVHHNEGTSASLRHYYYIDGQRVSEEEFKMIETKTEMFGYFSNYLSKTFDIAPNKLRVKQYKTAQF